MKIHNQIKQARIKSGLSQEQLSEITGIHRSDISRFENGKRNLNIPILEKICEAVGANLSLTTHHDK